MLGSQFQAVDVPVSGALCSDGWGAAYTQLLQQTDRLECRVYVTGYIQLLTAHYDIEYSKILPRPYPWFPTHDNYK